MKLKYLKHWRGEQWSSG